MPQETFDEIPELIAPKFISALMQSRAGSDRAEIVGALLGWIRILLDDCDAKTRTDVAQTMFCHACWLALNENFDEAAVKIVREPIDEWVARHC